VVPMVPDVSVIKGDELRLPFSQSVFQLVFVTNKGDSAIPNPIFLALDNLSSNATLVNAQGTTSVLAPLGSPYVQLRDGDDDRDDVLRPHETKIAILEFKNSTRARITYDTRVLPVIPTP
jgi:hypothetical protein